jgi:cytoskeletal protein RodZ
MPEQPQNNAPQLPQVKLGEILRDHRLAKDTEIPALARTLILSAAQITAIESGSQASFHNQSFYLRALKKYIAHANLETDPQASLLFTEIETELLSASTRVNPNEVSLLINAGLAHRRKSLLPQLNIKRIHLVAALLFILIAAGLVAILLKGGSEQAPAQDATSVVQTNTVLKTLDRPDEQKNAPAAAAAVNATTASIQSESVSKAEPVSENNKTSAARANSSGTRLKLVFSAPSWIQVIEQNGKRTEKVFTPNDSLELDPATLTSLVIGNARETKLFSNTTEIDLSKYLNVGSGVARFSESEIMKLVQ